MTAKDDMSIAKKLNLSVMDWHEFLGKMERLDTRKLNLLAMQLMFDIAGWEHIEPQEVTGKDNRETLDTFTERLDRIEAIIGALLARPVTGATPDGQNGTLIVPVCSPAEEQKTMQAKKEPESIPKGTTTTEQGTNEPQKDTIVSELDDAITRTSARLAALKAASFNKEKAANSSFSSTHASIGDEFKALFGVQVPVGFTDTAAVETMVARKKACKDIKSPLGYLASIAGKVSPITPTSATLNPTPPPALPSVNELPRLDHETITRINAM